MMIDPARMDWPRLVPFAILTASIGALIIAYTAELAFGIEPCILCLYQRIPYALAGALAVAALLAPSGLRGLSQLVKPMRWGYLPVNREARVGEQTLQELYARVNLAPCFANLSMRGVS